MNDNKEILNDNKETPEENKEPILNSPKNTNTLKKKPKSQVGIILAIVIPSVVVLFLLPFLWLSLKSCSLWIRPKPVFNNNSHYEINREIKTSDFAFDSAYVDIKHIKEEEYDDAKLINVFYDLNYNIYYKIDLTIIKNGEEIKANLFFIRHVYNTYQDTKRGYVFNIEINETVYFERFVIEHVGKEPVFRFGVEMKWKR